MRFKTPQPKFGDTRNVKCFAWFPVYIEDETVWLESYNKIQVYTENVPIRTKYGYTIHLDGWVTTEYNTINP